MTSAQRDESTQLFECPEEFKTQMLSRGESFHFDFVKEEYLTLRKEIESLINEVRQLERNSIIAIALSFTWISTQSSPSIDHYIKHIAWIIPSIIPIYGVVRSDAIGKQLGRLGKYIKTIESACISKDSGIIGWENYIDRNKDDSLTKSSAQFWRILAAISFSISVIGFLNA